MSRSDAATVQWHSLDLRPGQRVRIEASAGTGKTWTISVLYLRWLLETALSPKQILVATFSEAAAQELHERLRLRLIWAEQAAANYAIDHALPTGAADAAYLLQRWQRDSALCHVDRLRLRLALSELDLAPIGTLHSMCRRILADHPFACATPFEAGELISTATLRDEMLDDLKRQLAQSPAALADGDALWLAEFGNLGRVLERLADPTLHLLLPDAVDIDAIMAPENVRLLRDFADNVGQFARSNSAYRSALQRLAAFIEAGDATASFKAEPLLADSVLEGHIKPAQIATLSKHPAVQFAALAAKGLPRFADQERAKALIAYRAQCADWRERRLRERGQFTFDTLIERVHDALLGDGALADQLHAAWPVALIDEFQDTDARQYEILDRIHRHDDGTQRGVLVMIGDPKQAIYAFRGGDIHTYRRAVAAVDATIHLQVNHRSTPRYIAGLNAFYAAVAPALTRADATEHFPYLPVQASTRRDDAAYTIAGKSVTQPLVFHYRDDIPDAAGERTQLALQACAWQIAEMLQSGTHRINGHRLQPGDIAVLLPRNADVAALRELLIDSGVPCAGMGQQSVFQTEWATELQLILYALAHRDEAGALRAALSTRLLGFELSEIARLDRDAGAWQTVLERFHTLHELWQRQGVLAVVQQLLQQLPSALRVAGRYERIVTDVRHLGELLQEASETCRGPAQLLAWLDRQRSDPESGTDAAEDQQLRIESDAARTRLLTLHASKGLEFKIVMLPLMWAHQTSARAKSRFPITYDQGRGTRVIDLGSSLHDAHRTEADEDDQDERFRVLYVAMTRAEYACHVYALPPSRQANGQTKKSPVDPARSALDALIERLLALRDRDAEKFSALPGLAWCADNWPWTATMFSAVDDGDLVDPVVHDMPAARPSRSVHSFSNLVRTPRWLAVEEAAANDEALSDDDIDIDHVVVADVAGATTDRAPHPVLQRLDDVRGAALGNALHSIFEQRAPELSLRKQLPLMIDAFKRHDVQLGAMTLNELVLAWADRLDGALAADLGDELRLGALPATAQRAEMEFHFAVDQVQLDALRRVCARHGVADLIPSTLSTQALNGMVTGKIDLVLAHQGRFHVLDYKGNALSIFIEDYAAEVLNAAMDAHHYRFQALIYTLAVDRMLAARVPDYQRARDLGDAIYLFVRAAGLAPAAGIWRHRHDDALIADLQQVLSAPLEAT